MQQLLNEAPAGSKGSYKHGLWFNMFTPWGTHFHVPEATRALRISLVKYWNVAQIGLHVENLLLAKRSATFCQTDGRNNKAVGFRTPAIQSRDGSKPFPCVLLIVKSSQGKKNSNRCRSKLQNLLQLQPKNLWNVGQSALKCMEIM